MYGTFLHKKLYMIESLTTRSLFKECSPEQMKKNMETIRKICYMSPSAVEEYFKRIQERRNS